MSNVTVSVKDLVVRFGRTDVLQGISLEVTSGEVVGLVGPNGSGKSTTLRAITGLLPPQSGQVLVCEELAGSQLARRNVGLAPDDPSGMGLSTVKEFCSLVGVLWGNPGGYDERVANGLRLFGLSNRSSQLIESLSTGQRRIVSIVTLAALRPRVWVLDEATAALDPEAVIVLRELIRHAASSGASVLLATQDLPFAAACCDKTVLLSDGRVLDMGTPTELMGRYGATTLDEAFLSATFGQSRLQEVRDALAAF
jgi:ABC-2 type transport system ATP-binding protein